MVSWLVSGLPRQFMVIWENRRCSILFHLLVPGGKWRTVIVSPAARAASPGSTTRDAADISRLVAPMITCLQMVLTVSDEGGSVEGSRGHIGGDRAAAF